MNPYRNGYQVYPKRIRELTSELIPGFFQGGLTAEQPGATTPSMTTTFHTCIELSKVRIRYPFVLHEVVVTVLCTRLTGVIVPNSLLRCPTFISWDIEDAAVP